MFGFLLSANRANENSNCPVNGQGSGRRGGPRCRRLAACNSGVARPPEALLARLDAVRASGSKLRDRAAPAPRSRFDRFGAFGEQERSDDGERLLPTPGLERRSPENPTTDQGIPVRPNESMDLHHKPRSIASAHSRPFSPQATSSRRKDSARRELCESRYRRKASARRSFKFEAQPSSMRASASVSSCSGSSA